MRILLVSGAAYPSIGGIESSLLHIGKELINDGHQVKIFCFQISKNEPLRHTHEGIEIIRCGRYIPSRWPPTNMKRFVELTCSDIKPLLLKYRPDAIWSRYAPAGLGVVKAGYDGTLIHIFSTTANLKSKGTFLNTAGMPLKRRLLFLGAWPFCYRASFTIDSELIKNCQPVVFSNMMRDQLQKSYGDIANKTKVLFPGVDSERFSKEAGLRQIEKITDEYGLDLRQPLILCVGRLSVEKDVNMLLDAIPHLQNQARVVLVGSGPEESRIREYIKVKGIEGKVVMVGQQYELLPGFYSIAKVCVLPTYIESFGQVYLESLACGTPVVGFGADGKKAINATREIVIDGETGCIVNDLSPAALAGGIDRILSLSDVAYQQMSDRATSDVKQRFTWKTFVDSVLDMC